MVGRKIVLVIILVFSPARVFPALQENCFPEFECRYLGSVILSNRGLQKSFELGLQHFNSELIQQMNQYSTDTAKSEKINLFSSPSDCKAQKATTHVKEMLLGGNISLGYSQKTKSACLLYPMFNENGTIDEKTELVPFKVSIQNIRPLAVDWEVNSPNCKDNTCTLSANSKKVKVVANVIVERLDSPGKPSIIESPAFLVDAETGSAIVKMQTSLSGQNNLQVLKGEFSGVKLDPSKATVQLVVQDPHTKAPMDRKQTMYHVAEMAATERQEAFASLYQNSGDMNAFFEKDLENFLVEQAKFTGSTERQLKNLDKEIRKSFAEWKKKKPELIDGSYSGKTLADCRDFQCYARQFPSMKAAAQRAELQSYGFSNVFSQKMFEGVLDIIQRDSLKDPAVIASFERATYQKLQQASEPVNKTFVSLSDIVNKATVESEFPVSVPYLQLAQEARLGNLDKEKQKLEKLIKNAERIGYAANSLYLTQHVWEPRLKELLREREELQKSMGTDKGTLKLKPLFQQVDNLNRYGVFHDSNGQCQGQLKFGDLVGNKKDYEKMDMAADLPLSTIEHYLQSNARFNKMFCFKSYKEDCKGDSKIVLTAPPTIEWNEKEKSYEIVLRNAKAVDLPIIEDQVADVRIKANVDLCPSGNICVKLTDPKISGKTDFLRNDTFGKRTDAEKFLAKLVEKPVELEGVVPDSLKGVVQYAKPIQHPRGLIIPLEILKIPSDFGHLPNLEPR